MIPTLIIAYFIAAFLMKTTEKMDTTTVQESMRNSLAIAREYYDKLEHDSEEAAIKMVRDFEENNLSLEGAELEHFPRDDSSGEPCGLRRTLYSERHPLGSDRFASGEASQGRREFPAGLEYELMEANRIAFTDEDIIASGMRRDDRSLFVTGFVLSPGRIDQMRQTGDDLSRYNMLGIFFRKTRNRLRTGIIVLAVILVASSFVAARVVTRRTLRPLQQLAAATQRVADGDLTHRVDLGHKDARGEIGMLASSFNVMTGNLEQAQRNLARTERIARGARWQGGLPMRSRTR